MFEPYLKHIDIIFLYDYNKWKKACWNYGQSWEFYIGGYQPAQKWLKDRKNRTLTFQDVEQYEQIIAIMEETKRIMELIG